MIKHKAILCLVMSLSLALPSYASIWPAWQCFKQNYISNGRVIDVGSAQNITTSEGQSYAMFFALVANDKDMFDSLLSWTSIHLAQGDLSKHLPSWLWGKNKNGQMAVLDENDASDASLWLAYDLLEASRLWHVKRYHKMAEGLLEVIYQHRKLLPKLGEVILPGKVGFAFKDHWRLNPSYYPPQLLLRFAEFDKRWQKLYQTSLRILKGASPYGMAPDWLIWHKTKGWQADLITPNIGSYDAIRVYLWLGLLGDGEIKKSLVKHFSPMRTWVEQHALVPEKINVLTFKYQNKAPVGFYAALAPWLPKLWLGSEKSCVENRYYDSVLMLFSEGFQQGLYRFDAHGALQLGHHHEA